MSDVVVVGAGSAGAIVAARLAEQGAAVTLLEAGPDFAGEPPSLLTTDLRIPVTEYDWGYQSEGDRTIPLPRGRTVGGSSATNAVAAVRAQPADWDGWGLPAWTYAAVAAAESRFEADREFGDEPHHGSDGPIAIERPDVDSSPILRASIDAALACGYKNQPDMNAPGATGVGPQPYNATGGARQSTLVTYVRRARSFPGFTLRSDAHADRVLIERGVARGVVLADGTVVRGDRVIVSCGAFSTPPLLMRSGIGPASHLQSLAIPVVADLPVGDRLQDHPALPGVLAITRDPSCLPDDLLARFMIRTSFNGAEGVEDAHIFGPFTSRSVRVEMPPGGFVISAFAAKTRSHGTVRLRSRDPLDAPRIVLNYFEDDGDLEVLVRACRSIHALMQTEPLASLIESVVFPALDISDDDLRRYIRMGALTDHHPCGSAAIGPVLTEDCRVHGIDGLWVCDASVMPDNPRANTNLPTMTIAERFVELLRP